MGDSAIEHAIKRQAEKVLNDPVWVLALTNFVKDVNNGIISKKYVDVIGQKWREKFNIYDAFSFYLISYAITSGRIAIFQIPVNSEPFPDKEIVKNNEVLKKLEYPFSGEFFGGTQGEDGYIHWDTPINALFCKDNTKSFVIVESLTDKNGSQTVCPLEVGYIPFEKTLWYLRSALDISGGGNGLARWPYGQNRITVLIDHGIFTADDNGFEDLLEKVYGNFDTLPNPWDDW
jgi:hypothetical protein